MSYNVSELIKMKNKKKKQVSQENRILESDLLSRQSILTQNAISEEKLYEQRNTRQTKTYDVTSASLDVWLDEFIKYDPRARGKNSEGARALIRVSEQSNREGQWPKMAPQRNYKDTKYSNDLSVNRQKLTPKPIMPDKYFMTPKFAKKTDHHMFSKALPKLYDQRTGRRMPGFKWKPINGLKSILKKPKRKKQGVKFKDDITDMIEEIIMSPSVKSREMYPSTNLEKNDPIHKVPPAVFPLPALLPPDQFLDPDIKLNEPLLTNVDELEVHERFGRDDGDTIYNNTAKKNKHFLRCTIKYNGALLLVNLKRNPKKKHTTIWTLHASSGTVSKHVFSNMKSIHSAANDNNNMDSIKFNSKHINYAINWAHEELPKLMHDASIFLAFHALINGLQNTPTPTVLNQYASLRNRLESPPSAVPSRSRRSHSPLLQFLDALDPRKSELAPITSLEKLQEFGGSIFRPKSSPGRIKHNDKLEDEEKKRSVVTPNQYHPEVPSDKLDGMSRKQHGSTGSTYSALPNEKNRHKVSHAASPWQVPAANLHEIPGQQRTSLATVARAVKGKIHAMSIFRHDNSMSSLIGRTKDAKSSILSSKSNQHHGLHYDHINEVTLFGQDADTESDLDDAMSIASTTESKYDEGIKVGGTSNTILREKMEHTVILQTTMKLPDFYDIECKDFSDYFYYFVEIVDIESELHVVAIRANTGMVLRKVVSGEFLANMLAKYARKHGEILRLYSPNPETPTICKTILRRLATVTGDVLLFRNYTKRE